MMKKSITAAVIMTMTLLSLPVWAGQDGLDKLGEYLYKDKNLSLNKNQSCMTCHHPAAGFADPENRRNPIDFPVSDGSDPTLFGGRNAPSAAYAGFSPIFGWDDGVGGYTGGMFWDGRATGTTLLDPLAEQALGPFLNPVEMAMTKEAVVAAVATSNYVQLFQKEFPDTDFSDIDGTFTKIGFAIAAFERSTVVTRFGSKFDTFWRACQQRGIDVSKIDTGTDLATLPSGILTTSQLQGLAIFNDTTRGNCAACHPTTNHTDAAGNVHPPLFTNYSFDNLGIPTNWRVYELAGGSPPDLGLGGRSDINDSAEYGKFKVPTLRNIAKSAPYGHNGYFPTLEEIVNFYNTRDVSGWDAAEVPTTVNMTELGDLGLTPDEERQIVTFLKALTDS